MGSFLSFAGREEEGTLPIKGGGGKIVEASNS